MKNARRIALAGAVAVTTLLLTASAVAAQTPGEFNQVPEAAPQNWSWLFMAVPIAILAVAFTVVFWLIYASVMTRLRYPRASKS